jgi:hypothetical protein
VSAHSGSSDDARGSWLDAQRRARGPACLSHLALDALAAGELPADEATRVTAHLGSCASCQSVSEELAAERAAFARDAALPTLAADALARAETQRASGWRARLWRRAFIAPLAVLAAGTAVLLVNIGGLQPTARSKGEFSLSPYVLHPESGVSGDRHLGEPLHPSDRLQFRYNGAQAGYLAVVAVDSTGRVSVYYPPGAAAAAVPAGREIPLASAVELDGTLGREVIIGVRCEAPVPVARVADAARQGVEAARARGVAPTDLGPLGLPCVETRHQITKLAAPAP